MCIRDRMNAGFVLPARTQSDHASDAAAAMRLQGKMCIRDSICTIDAFCMQLLKRYFAELGLPPDFELADDAKAYTLRQNAFPAEILRQIQGKVCRLYRQRQTQAPRPSVHKNCRNGR